MQCEFFQIITKSSNCKSVLLAQQNFRNLRPEFITGTKILQFRIHEIYVKREKQGQGLEAKMTFN